MHRNFSALEIASHLIQNYPIFTKKNTSFLSPNCDGKTKKNHIDALVQFDTTKFEIILRFESTKVLHINFQKSVHVPSVNESSIFRF